jgi:hypothetical protein
MTCIGLTTITHDLDTTQRYIRLTESSPKTSTQVFVHTPKNGGIAPAGKYMLFGISYQGVPSVAKYVTLQ